MNLSDMEQVSKLTSERKEKIDFLKALETGEFKLTLGSGSARFWDIILRKDWYEKVRKSIRDDYEQRIQEIENELKLMGVNPDA